MSREYLMKLRQKLVSSILAMSLMGSVASCSKQDENKNIINNQNKIEDIIDSISDFTCLDENIGISNSDMFEILYSYDRSNDNKNLSNEITDYNQVIEICGNMLLKSYIIDALKINQENVIEVKILDNYATVYFYEVDSICTTFSNKRTKIEGTNAKKMLDVIKKAQNKKIDNVEENIEFFKEFLLTTGDFSDKESIEFNIDNKKVENYKAYTKSLIKNNM